MKLEAGKTYVTRDQSKVKIVAIDMQADEYNQAIGWRNGFVESWDAGGRFYDEESGLDIVAEEPSAVELLAYSLPVVGTLNVDNPRREAVRRAGGEGGDR